MEGARTILHAREYRILKMVKAGRKKGKKRERGKKKKKNYSGDKER